MWLIDISQESRKNSDKGIYYVWFQVLSDPLILIILQRCRELTVWYLYSFSKSLVGKLIKSGEFFPLYTTWEDWWSSPHPVIASMCFCCGQKCSKMQKNVYSIYWKNSLIQTELIWKADEELKKKKKNIPKANISRAMSFLSLLCRSFYHMNLLLSQKYEVLTIFYCRLVSDFQF